MLARVERGGHSSDLLLEHSEGLDSRDAGLAAEIVFGCLRRQAQLDYLITLFSGRPAAGLDAAVRIALRMGVYQLRYLDRVPAHAAVGESVELVKEAGKRSAAGFVNAVLRKVDRDPVTWPDRATELSEPAWLLERWDRHFGKAMSERIAKAFLEAPATYLRIPSGEPPAGLKTESTEVPGCFRLLAGDPQGFRIQDLGSQTLVPLLDLQAGHWFLDLCAAPGNKTAQALECGVRAVACDLRPGRLSGLKKLGCDLAVLDAAEPLPFGRRFDRILLDVPCSGTGTVGRNPEIRWRFKEPDLGRHHEKQVKMLSSALKVLAPGGRLLYSTCSLEPEENEAVVEEVLGGLPQRIHRRLPGRDAGDGFFAAVIPSS